ncbi:MAG: serine/threonine-protein kinase [Gemmatimonadales bacterium]|nr:serine/threonine protein kinase [Gemmatimonadales bacterium]MDX2060439.1 serine/threonine-protein kinase [Gemmatimonadales bacterium]
MSDFAKVVAADYELIRELGRGGMGIVHLARDLKLDRLVALKVLPPAGAANDGLRDRFLREARTAAQLSHPNIVPVYRADQTGGFAFFAMGFVDGESLAERLARLGSIAPAEAVRLLREAAWALAYAHARGVIHRDVKPENLMLEKGTGRVVVTDFGIARDLRATRLTEDGQVLGSVHYMSPEQIAGASLDGRSDLYSLGVVGFQCLSGRLPFDAAQASAVLVQHAVSPPTPLRAVAPDVPASLAAVIDRCLAKDPAERFPNCEALAAALTAALEDHQPATDGSTALTEADARAIWRRAAELQIDAATRIRRRTDTASLPVEADHASGGFRIAEIRSAAEEAGIGPEFVSLALAERAPGGSVPDRPSVEGEERAWTTMLGTSARSITAQRTFRAPPRRVLDAIGKVFPVFPYTLQLQDTVGGHPLDGGVMVFAVPMMRAGTVVGGQGLSMFSYRLTQIEVERLTVRIRAVDGSRSSTEVAIQGDLRSGLRKNWKVDRGIAAVMGMVGGGLAAAIGLGPLGWGLAVAAAPAAAGAALLGAGSLGWYRWLYRSALKHSQAELDRLLAAVDGEIRSEAVFGEARAQALPPGPPPGSRWPAD